jgi:hypothetical protein
MAAPTISLTSALPVSETRAIETMWIDRYLQLVAHAVRAVRAAGGQVTSGTITDRGVTLGSFTYVPGASS